MEHTNIPELELPSEGGAAPPEEPHVDVLVIRKSHQRTSSNTSSLSSASDMVNSSLPSSLLLNVSSLGSDDGSGSNCSTLIGGQHNCDGSDKPFKHCNSTEVPSDISDVRQQTLRYAVIKKKSLDKKLNENNNQENTLGLKVHLVKGNLILFRLALIQCHGHDIGVSMFMH